MEPDAHAQLRPGVQVVAHDQPIQHAERLARELGAELLTTVEQVEAVLFARDGAALDEATLADMERLGHLIAQTDDVARRTRERAAGEVSQRLAAATGAITVHPETVRARAAAVIEARAALVEAERAIAAEAVEVEGHAPPLRASAGPHPGRPLHAAASEGSPGPDVAEAPPTSPARRADRAGRAGRRTEAVGAVVAAFGLALIAIAVADAPLWAALLLPLVAALWAIRHLRPRHRSPEGTAGPEDDEASVLLARISAESDERFESRRAVAEPVDFAGTSDPDRVRQLAEDALQLAERAWRDVAGEDAQVDDVESVIERIDPQHRDARLLADETVGVRAAEAVRQQLAERWAQAWARAGQDVPEPGRVDVSVRALRERLGQPVVLVAGAAERAEALAVSTPLTPLLAVVPEVELSAGEAADPQVS